MNALSPMHPESQELEAFLPVDFEAEQQLIGAVLMKPALVDVAAEIVQPEHFADETHIKIWSIIAENFAAGRITTPPGVNARLKDDEGYIGQGGSEYLMRVVASVVMTMPTVIEEYSRRVADMWLRRCSIISLREASQRLATTTDEFTGAAVLEGLEVEIATITGTVGDKDRTAHYSAALNQAMVSIEKAWKADGKLQGVTTGLTDLDAKLGGLHPTDLLILAGRPSMGKSALAWNMSEAAARAGHVVAFFSLEMSSEQLSMRAIAADSGIDAHRLREGRINGAEAHTAGEAATRLKALSIFIDDTASLSPSQIRTRARRIKRKHGLGLIVIDYLQLMSAPLGASGRGQENRTQEVSVITRALKGLAKELEVPVVALSQLSRQCESREDKRPLLSDLRESGSIEQDADVVMFVYRDEYYLGKAQPSRRGDEGDEKFNARYAQWERNLEACTNQAEIIIGKQRHGPTGTVKVFFEGRLTKFGNLHSPSATGGGGYYYD